MQDRIHEWLNHTYTRLSPYENDVINYGIVDETLIHKGVIKFTFYMYIRQDIQILYSRSKVGREEGNGII